MPYTLSPNHCGWCGGVRRAVLLALASGMRPTDAAREAGCTRHYARTALFGAIARGCLPGVPYAPMPPKEAGRRSGEARRANAPLRLAVLFLVAAYAERHAAKLARRRARYPQRKAKEQAYVKANRERHNQHNRGWRARNPAASVAATLRYQAKQREKWAEVVEEVRASTARVAALTAQARALRESLEGR